MAGGVLDLPPLAYSSIHGTEAAPPDFLYSMRRLAELGDPAVGVVRELIDRGGRSDSDLLLDPSSIKWLPPQYRTRRRSYAWP